MCQSTEGNQTVKSLRQPHHSHRWGLAGWLMFNVYLSIQMSIYPSPLIPPTHTDVFCVKVVEFIRWESNKFVFNVAVIFYLLFDKQQISNY